MARPDNDREDPHALRPADVRPVAGDAPVQDESELTRIRQAYRRYETSPKERRRRDPANPGLAALLEEARGSLINRVALAGVDLEAARVLDLGCGDGRLLSWLVAAGAREDRCVGVDLMADRVQMAAACLPEATILQGDASSVEVEDGAFDVVVMSMLLSSILTDRLRERVCAEALRVVRHDGCVVVYDTRYPSPGNRDVRAVGRRALKRLFPGASTDITTLTLVPPLARRLGRTAPRLYPLLAGVRLLRARYLALVRPPGRSRFMSNTKELREVSPLDVVEPPVEPIVFGKPDIREDEIREVVDTLRSGWIGTGPKTHQFERAFAEYLGAPLALATSSATAALHLGLDAVGVGPGDEVITTPMTFVATANVIEHRGATPVFVDVRRHDGNIDPAAVADAISARTKAILPVHYAGALADVPELQRIGRGIPIIVDAAHAIEARYSSGEGSAGHGAVCTAYSFYVTKNLITGEGGMLVMNDEQIEARARMGSLHGLDTDAWKRYKDAEHRGYDAAFPGFKYNMTDIQASLGLHQLARIDQAQRRRQEIWRTYNDAFADLEGVEIPSVAIAGSDVGCHARHLYTLWLDWAQLGRGRQQVVTQLRAAGIGVGWHFKAVHLHHYYAESYGLSRGRFPVAESISDRTVSLPLSPALSDSEVDRVIEAVRLVIRDAL